MRVLTTNVRLLTSAVALLVLAIGGCTKSPESAEVDGVLTIDGKPGHKIRIQFLPDAAKGTQGPESSAETDDQGRFTLQLMDPNGPAKPGAIVGWHRVVLNDLQLAQSETGVGVPIRLPMEHTAPGSTPLEQEVKPGKQSIELKITSPPK